MLRQRVITALAMAGTVLAVLIFLPLPVIALFFGLVVALGGWEWSRMAGWTMIAGRVVYIATLLAGCIALYWYCDLGTGTTREQVQPFLGLACLWWAFALLWVKGYPASATLWRNVPMRSFMGALILVPAWLAAVYLLTFPRGAVLLVVMIVIVACADIGAYFAGSRFGKHALAPTVSPKKTWEGFWGGIAACVALAVVLWLLLPAQHAHMGLDAVLAIALSTALASVLGDLSVSMVKRETGVKDSGTLLPGHGGLLDRLDSICAAAPVFALGLLLAGWK